MIQSEITHHYKLGDVEQQSTSTLIGVLDASGSMSSHWPLLAECYNKLREKVDQFISITFSDVQKVFDNIPISPRIRDCGGGGANICQCFETLNSVLQRLGQIISLFCLYLMEQMIFLIQKREQLNYQCLKLRTQILHV